MNGMPPDAGSMREERRVVTALFADLVGSTALGERLDPEELKLIIADAVGRMVGAVEAFGGNVKDLAGDGLLALFGAPVAHEDDAERAIRSGLRIVEEISSFAREVERGWDVTGFDVRVGIDTGPAVVGAIGAGSRIEYSALGDAVNTAARLQSHASPGTVLVGPETFRLTEPLFSWGASAELELKGKKDTVLAHPVEAPLGSGPAPRGLEGVQTRMIGREQELETGLEAVDSVLEGSGGILHVVGEPGIGKTRLLRELRGAVTAAPAHHGRALWMEGRCVSYGESMPYWPFRDLLRSWLGVSGEEPDLRLRVSLRGRLERLFDGRAGQIEPYLAQLLGLASDPREVEHLAELSPEALQYRTFEVVRTLLTRLAQDGPVVVALEDLHWADATSVQLLARLLADTETAALLLVLTMRPERDHLAWGVKEEAARDLPHRSREVSLAALSGDSGRELLHAFIGADTLPPEMEQRILEPAEGNPFFLEELIRSFADAGALVRDDDTWRFDHAVPIEIPPTIEQVILSRIDRLSSGAHTTLTAASVLGRRFRLPMLQALVPGGEEIREPLTELQRLDLLREGRRWPDPEYRFRHALIQEVAYRTLVRADREGLHRTAAAWLEERYADRLDEVAGLLAHHWLGANDEDKAVAYLVMAGDRARQHYALDEAVGHYRELVPLLERRGERQEVALVLFKLALALHMSLRFAEANQAYQRAFAFWTPPAPADETPAAVLRVSSSFLPNDPDPRSAIAWPNIQLCMNLFDRLVEQWPERTIVPNLADRWEIADDGLRYVFHLRDGLTWSDGAPLTAHDVEFGIKRVLNPDAPGSSVAIYFVLEAGEDYYLRRHDDPDLIGVRALDDLTVEFRLAAPAPYFMSVMNRPDGGPQPRHAIEARGDTWVAREEQVVSGPFRIASGDDGHLVLERRPEYRGMRDGNVGRVEYVRCGIEEATARYGRDELDLMTVRYTPRIADLVADQHPDAHVGQAAWSGYLAFNHEDPVTSNLDLRLALAQAIDREALGAALPTNFVLATGGVVPPALQGHTPEIALRYDPDAAREHLARSGIQGPLALASFEEDAVLVEPVARAWREVLGLTVEQRAWTLETIPAIRDLREVAPIVFTGWLPGYADPEYILRLLFQSTSKTNEGHFSWPPFDELIERARQERSDRGRLELFHEADRMVVRERVACIPLVYGRSMAIAKPWVRGWREFGKTSANFADLQVTREAPE
jgi:ABC-type oligopeptide transport system substrate-binding subunit/class 3 adenylate cyclase